MTVILRPMSTGELLDQTFSLYRHHFKLFVGIAAVAQLPLLLLQVGQIPLASARADSALIGSGLVLLGVVVFLGALAASQGATVVAVSAVYLDQPTSVTTAYSKIRSRILGLVMIMVGAWVAVGAGFLFLVVPGIIFALMWALIIPVAVLENSGLSKSAKRSQQLTKGSRGRIFLIFLLFVVLSYLAVIIANLPMFVAVGILRNPSIVPVWVQLLNSGTNFIGQSLAAPLLTIALSLAYYDARVRKEGYDIQIMMDSLEKPQAKAAEAAF